MSAYFRQVIWITAFQFLTICYGIIQDLPTSICVFRTENYSIGRNNTQALITRKYDYNIQNCHLMCFSISRNPPRKWWANQAGLYLSKLLWLLWVLRWPRKGLIMTALNMSMTLRPPSDLCSLPMTSLSFGTQIPAWHIFPTLTPGLLQCPRQCQSYPLTEQK